jgi:hypothetical protein
MARVTGPPADLLDQKEMLAYIGLRRPHRFDHALELCDLIRLNEQDTRRR